MKNTKKIISVFIALCLLICAFPAMAFAEATEYPLFINDVQVTSENCADILSDGSAVYDPTSKTLTLRSAKISSSDALSSDNESICAIYCADDLSIVLDGSSTIVADGTKELAGAVGGIIVAGDLTIRESAKGGSLSVNVKAKDAFMVVGIATHYDTKVESGTVTVTADGGIALETAVAPASNDRAANGEPDKSEDKPAVGSLPELQMDIFGEDGAAPGYPGEVPPTYTECTAISSGEDYIQSGGTVTATASSAIICEAVNAEGNMTVTGGKLTATGGAAEEYSAGIVAEDIAISGSSTVVSAKGGVAKYISAAIVADNDYTQTAGTVTATAGKSAANESEGVYVYGRILVSGGALNAYGADDSYYSHGIYTGSGVELTGGSIKAVGGSSEDNSYGLYSDGAVTVSGGTLDMRSGVAGYNSLACECESHKMIVSGGTVNAVSATSGSVSYGLLVGKYEQTGGKVTASAGNGRYASAGMSIDGYAGDYEGFQVNILGGTLTATSSDAGEESVAIHVNNDGSDLVVSGVDTVVTAKSGKGESYGSVGIMIDGDLIIEDGAAVIAEAGESSGYSSNGVCASNIALTGGVLRGTANEAFYGSNGIYTDGLVVNSGEVFGTSNAAKAKYINGIVVDDYDDIFSTSRSGKLELIGGSVTALCNDSVSDRSASAIWAENGIIANERYTATGAQETYESGINELRQKVSGTPVVLKASGDVVRLSGNSRVLTAIEISKKGWADGSDTVILASGNNYADVLAVVPYAYKLDAPVLLSVSATLDADILAEIERLGASKAIILGGTAAVPQAVEDSIKAEGLTVERIFGSSRNETAAKIAEKLEPTSGEAFLVSNANFADAISCSSIAALLDAPILYINADGTLPTETKTALEDIGIEVAYIIGGTGAVGAAAETQLEALAIEHNRIFGNNRYATSVEVYNEFAYEYATTRHAAATGKAFPDATAGAAFAAKLGMHIFLVDEGMPDSIASTLRGRGVETLYIFGGTSAVTTKTVETIL